MVKRSIVFLFAISLFSVSLPAQTNFRYPEARKSDQVDVFHGTKVYDPYRWLEETDSEETQKWIRAQNELTFGYLRSLPHREALRERLTELWNYERLSAPSKIGDRYIYSRNDGLQNQSVLYITDSIRDPGRVFFDPNKLSADGTAALSGSSFTEDGKLWAYGIARAGSDRTEWRVMNVETGEHLSDTLRPNRQGGVSWLKDGSGFFYSRFPDAQEGQELRSQNFYQKLYFHKLGTSQDEDKVVYERPDNKEYFINGRVSEDGKWLVINVGQGTRRMNMVYFKDLTKDNAPILPLVTDFAAAYGFLGNDGPVFYFQTDRVAPLGKVVSVNVLARQHVWKEIVPEAKETLRGVNFINNWFVLNYLKDAYTQIRIVDTDGKHIRNVELPGIGSAGGFGGRRNDTETFYTYSSYNAPPTIYRYDMESGKSELFRRAAVKFNPDDFEVKQVFYTRKVSSWTERTRLSFTAMADLTSLRHPAFRSPACRGSKWAASMRSRVSVAAANMERNGGRPVPCLINRTFSTISSPRANTLSPANTHRAANSLSRAVRTAVCSSVLCSISVPISSVPPFRQLG